MREVVDEETFQVGFQAMPLVNGILGPCRWNKGRLRSIQTWKDLMGVGVEVLKRLR